MICRVALLSLLLAIGLAPAGAAKLYKWVDRQGNVSYRDYPPPEGSGYRAEEKPIRLGSPSGKKDDPNARAAEKFPIVLYTAPKCDSCGLARAYLEKRKVPYTEKNVEGNLKLQDELKTKSGSLTVPTILVGTKLMKGYLESLLEGELDQAGYTKIEPSGSDAANRPDASPR